MNNGQSELYRKSSHAEDQYSSLIRNSYAMSLRDILRGNRRLAMAFGFTAQNYDILSNIRRLLSITFVVIDI
jgi:hypothetical protein